MEEEDVLVYLKTLSKIQSSFEADIIAQYNSQAYQELQELTQKLESCNKELENLVLSCKFSEQIFELKKQILESSGFELKSFTEEAQVQNKIFEELRSKGVPDLSDGAFDSFSHISNKIEKSEVLMNSMQQLLVNPVCKNCIID